MSWVAVAVAAVAAGTAAYSSDQQRKATHQQADALKLSQEQDARNKAEADTQSQLAANADIAASKQRRRTSALSLGDPTNTGDTLGAPSALASGASSPMSRQSSTVLGSAAK